MSGWGNTSANSGKLSLEGEGRDCVICRMCHSELVKENKMTDSSNPEQLCHYVGVNER